MENELKKISENGLTPSSLSSLVSVATEVGEKLGDALSDFIDKCYGVNNKNK